MKNKIDLEHDDNIVPYFQPTTTSAEYTTVESSATIATASTTAAIPTTTTIKTTTTASTTTTTTEASTLLNGRRLPFAAGPNNIFDCYFQDESELVEENLIFFLDFQVEEIVRRTDQNQQLNRNHFTTKQKKFHLQNHHFQLNQKVSKCFLV